MEDKVQRYPVYVEGTEGGFSLVYVPENHPLVADTVYESPDFDYMSAVLQKAYEVAEPIFKKSPEDEPEEISQEAWNTVALMTAIHKMAQAYRGVIDAHRRGEEIATMSFATNMHNLTAESDEFRYKVNPMAVAELEGFIGALEPTLSKEEVKAVYEEMKAIATQTYMPRDEDDIPYRGEAEGFPLEWLGLQPNIPPPTPPAPNIHSIGKQVEKQTPEPMNEWEGATFRHKTNK